MSPVWITSVVALWVVVLFMGFLLAGALRQIGLFKLRLGDDLGALITEGGLERGVLGPDFSALDAESGDVVRLYDLPDIFARPLLMVFVTPFCLACRQLGPHLNEVAATWGKQFNFLVVCSGDSISCQSYTHNNRLKVRTLIDEAGSVSQIYQAQVTPFAYVLDQDRRVLIRGVASDWVHFESLLQQEGTLEADLTFTRHQQPQAPQDASAKEA